MDSQPTTPLAQRSSSNTELVLAVAELFSAFDRFFPQSAWQRISADSLARSAWLRALDLAKLDPRSVRVGISRASQLDWPPSVGKFIELCQPRLPDEEEARQEAIAACRNWDRHEWSHVLAQATAQAVGTWQLRNLPERDCRMVWAQAWRQMVERFRKGIDLSTPVRRALPSTERSDELRRQRKAQGPTPAGTAAAAALRSLLGSQS